MREPARRFEDLVVWRKAHEFVLEVYRMTEAFPKHEVFGLTSQLRRAAVSIPANICEGFRRRGRRNKARFMNIAEGSLNECDYYLLLAQELAYAQTEPARASLGEVSRLLRAYAQAILASNS